ncbi:MAG: hypothetical protein RLZZ507_3924 [Cyanobacteriota bacterium]|jgi:tetratricopeptide (TPR) repeat protein/S1-C subfamily serine protease
MKLHKFSHLLLFFLLLFPASPIIITGCSSSLFARKPGTLSESELKNILKEITVKIIVDDRETASGTIIKKQNGFYTVLTNAHVIENAKSVKVVTPDNKTHDVEFSKLDRQDNKKDDLYDLARLTFSSETTYLVAGLGEENIKPGEKVFAGGYVKGNLQTTKGTAKLFLNQPLIKGQQIAYNNDIQQGMSGGAIINEKGYLVGINSKLANPVLQTDFRYLQGEQPDEKTLKEWGNYSWGIAVNLVDEAAPDLSLFPERLIRKIGGIPAKVLDIAKQSSVKIEGKSGIGSGVIIAKDKDVYYVLTAAHVVENKQEYQVVAPDKQVYKVDNETIRTRKGLDMAVLQFRSSQVYQVATLGDYKLSDEEIEAVLEFRNFKSNTKLGNQKLSGKGQLVFLYGWKGEEINHPSLFNVGGMLDADGREIWAKKKGYELAYSNETYSGMSGGGIWDTEGRLIGIHNYAETDFLGYSLGLSIQSFLFYQKEDLCKLPQTALNIANNQPKKNADESSFFLLLLPIFDRPNNVNSSGYNWLNYGITLWRIRDYDNAINIMSKAISKDPNLWQANYNISLIKFSLQQYNDALKYINKAIEKQDNFYRLYWLKAKILDESKEYTNALHTLNRGIEEAKKQEKEEFYIYNFRGDIFYKLNRYNEAIADYSQAITLNPQYAVAYDSRGVVYGQQGNLDQAIQDFNAAINISPQFTEAYINRGAAYGQQGKINLAIVNFNQAISISPQFAEAYVNRGNIYYKQEKFKEAIQDFNQALMINPHNDKVYFIRGIAYVKQNNLDKAIHDFNQAITINPKSKNYINILLLVAYTERGFVKNTERKTEQAIQDFNQAITISPKSARPYYGRGLAYALQGTKQQAIKDLETAKQLFQQQGNIQESQKIQELLHKL